MGVPTLTMRGERDLSRARASIMAAAGLDTFVVDSESAFVARAAALASDLDALAVLRAGLRERLCAAPLFDGARFARGFAELARELWARRKVRP